MARAQPEKESAPPFEAPRITSADDPVRAAAASLLAIEYLVRRLAREESFDERFDLACQARDAGMLEMHGRLRSVPADHPLHPALHGLTSAYANWSKHWDELAPSDALDAAFDELLKALRAGTPASEDDPDQEASGHRPAGRSATPDANPATGSRKARA